MFEKSSHKNRPGYYYLGGPKSLKLLLGILYNESKHNILAYQGKANKIDFLKKNKKTPLLTKTTTNKQTTT
jgi:hypothetical protein